MNIWDGIEEFVTVSNDGTFSGAARKLGVSTSFVSRQINTLEAKLGVQLLKRTTRKLNFTEEGELYYKHCNELLKGLENANEALARGKTAIGGLIRISASGTFAEKELSGVIAKFINKYPDVNVFINFDQKEIDFIEKPFDLEIRYGILKDSTLRSRKLSDRRLSICASPSYLEKYGTPKAPHDLKAHSCLLGNNNRWRLQFPEGVREISVKGCWKSNSAFSLIEAASQSLGLIYIPDYYTKEKQASGELVSVLNDYVVKDHATWLVYPNMQHLPIRIRLLIDFMTEHFNSQCTID